MSELIIFLGFIYFMQVFWLILFGFVVNGIKTKREVKLYLIPFVPIIYGFLKTTKSMIKDFKKKWSELK